MAANHGNSLSADSLGPLMVSSLPKTADPKLKTPWDAVALFCHVCMLSVGFRLVGLGEDHRIEDASSEVDNTKPLPNEWNAATTSDYAFRYAHHQSSLQFLIKISRLGSKAVINGLGVGDDKVTSFDISVKDYLSVSSFPFTIDAETAAPEASRSVQNLFISPGRIGDLSALVKINILQKLAPGLDKEGYEESAHAASPHAGNSSNRDEERQQRQDTGRRPPQNLLPPFAEPQPFRDPLLANPPRRPFPASDFPPPGFEDEHQILRPGGRSGYPGERRPLNIGERDLYPPGLGPHDPLRMGGPSGGYRGGGGMHPTFDDPMFGGNGGVGGYSPRAPPGARYDPVHPGDDPYGQPEPYDGPRLPRGPGGGFGGGGGGPPNPFGGFGRDDFI